MTLAEILKLLGEQAEIKTGVIEALTKDGSMMTKEQAEQLNKDIEANRNAILYEKRELKGQYDKLKADFDALSSKQGDKAKGDKHGGTSEEVEVLNAKMKELAAELEKAKGENSNLTSQINNSYIEAEIGKHLDKLNVAAPHRELLLGHFKGQAALKNTEDQSGQKGKLLMFGDKMADSFFGEWGKSDVAKHYIKAPDNNGGGSGGGSPAGDGGGDTGIFKKGMFKQ